MKKKILLILAGVALVALSGCAGAEEQKNIKGKETIKVGAVLPLTGPAASLGQAHRETIEWKVSELNKEGYNVELYLEDSQADPGAAVSAFNNLVQTKQVRIVLTTLSSDTLAIKPLAEEYKVVVWTDATHPDILKDTNFLLRHSFVIDRDAEIIMENIIARGFGKIGFLYQQDDVGERYRDVLIGLGKNKNVDVVADYIDRKSSDFKTPIMKMAAQEPDILVFVTHGPAAGLLVKQAKELGFGGAVYSWPGFVATPDAVTIAGEYAKGMYYSTFQESEDFVNDFEIEFGKEPSVIGSWKYLDLELLVYAIEQTGSQDPEKIISFIKNLDSFEGKYERVEIEPNGDIVVPTMVRVWK